MEKEILDILKRLETFRAENGAANAKVDWAIRVCQAKVAEGYFNERREWVNRLPLNETFIKNVLDVEVDGLKCINRYVVRALYDVEQSDGSYKLDQRIIEDVSLTWDEIEDEGGIAEINKQLKECYNV